jgi:hypothetical protein
MRAFISDDAVTAIAVAVSILLVLVLVWRLSAGQERHNVSRLLRFNPHDDDDDDLGGWSKK